MVRLRSRLIGLALGVVALVGAASCTSPSSPTPSDPPRASGEAVDAVRGDVAGNVDIGNGRGLYLECRGSGSPTVVLLSGFGNAGDIWSLSATQTSAVAPAVAGFARVCSYDRPGSYLSSKTVDGKVVPLDASVGSAPARGTAVAVPLSTAAAVVTDLKALLTAADVAPPYVLVGHSIGGLFTEAYARSHPDDVAGKVFVDTTTTQLRTLVPPKLYDSILVDQVTKAPSQIAGYRNETYDINESFDQVEQAKRASQPAILLVAGQGQSVSALPPGITQADLDEVHRLGMKAQREFAASIGTDDVRRVPDSSHYIQALKPEVVIQAVRDMVDRVQAGR